jgi:protein involved in polysaccharide export with SLBB domain
MSGQRNRFVAALLCAFAPLLAVAQDPPAPPTGAQMRQQPAQGLTITNPSPAPTRPPAVATPPARATPDRKAAQPTAAAQEPPARPAETQDHKALPEPTERNEFQQFIADSLGEKLPLYGYSFFQSPPSTFAPVDNVPVTPDYAIGPGDELLIRAWGQIDIDYRAVVDRNGMINIPRIGSLPVAGVQYKDITPHVRTAVSRNFRNFELIVTLGELRSIQVFVVGQARRPGVYTVSSLSTLVNAVFAAGGPSARGSMRAIQLKRGNSVVTELDLYELMAFGDKSKDRPLLPGDVIYFPPVGPLAALAGSVNHPAVFELKAGAATNVGQLIDLGGGLTTTAQTRRATIERIDDRQSRSVDQFSLDYDGLRRAVKDGDVVSVLSISPRIENAVTLRGKVANPLRYPFRPGMRLLDLIPEREALITPDYYTRKNLSVLSGPVVQGQLAYDVRHLADEINWDYAVIERLDRDELTTKLIPFNLGKAIRENDPSNNLPLAPGDVVTVFSKTDVAPPAGRRTAVVSLEGELSSAGVYQALPGETLRQLVVRVGGVTADAYLFGAEFTRESTRRDQEQRLKQAIDQLEQDVQRAAATRAQNVVSAEDASGLAQQTEAQRALVARLRTLKPTGRVVLEMPENPGVAQLPDIALEDGDRLLVPKQPSTVSVFGTVFNEAAFLFTANKQVNDYLDLAGGPRKQADRSSIYLLRANGAVVSARQSGMLASSLSGRKVMPGDTIVVPENFERTTWTKDLRDWTQIFYQFGLGAAALKVLQD